MAPKSKFTHALQLHLFEHIIPASLIWDVLTETGGWEEREKALNMPMVIAIIIAMGLLARVSIPHVLHKLACALRSIWPDPRLRLPGASAISQRRKPLGVTPLRRLFERGGPPRATPQTPGAFAFGLRLMAIDSTVERVADAFALALTFGSPSNQHGSAAYPQVRGIYWLECATHLIVDALFRPYRPHELQGAFARLAFDPARHAGALGSGLSLGALDPGHAGHAGPRAGAAAQPGRAALPAATLGWPLSGLPLSRR